MPYFIFYALALAAILLLALTSFLSNRKSKVNITFAVLLLTISIWIVSLYFFYTLDNPLLVLRIGRLNFSSIVWLSTVLLYFSYLFPKKTIIVSGLIKYLVLVETVFLSTITLFTPLVGENEIIQGESRITEYGPLYVFFVGHFIGAAVASILIMVKKYRILTGREKLQLKYIIVGITLSVLVGSITNILIPYVAGYYDIQHIGVIAPVIFSIFVSYVIAKHRLMDIRLIILRLVVYVLLLFTLSIFYTATLVFLGGMLFSQSYSSGYLLFTVGVALIGVYTFPILRRYFEQKTAKFLYKDYYESHELLGKITHAMASTLNVEEVGKSAMSILNEFLHISKIALVLIKASKVSTISDDHFDLSCINLIPRDRGLIVFEELQDSKLKGNLRECDIEVALPIGTGDGFTGFLLLSKKSSGDTYYEKDLQSLAIIGPEMAIALQNAQRYEEIKQFSKKLEAEVEAATSDLKQANKKLQLMDKQKDEFISVVAHELRSPVTAIKGFVSLILDGDTGEIPKEAREYLGETFNATERMVRLVTNMLNVSRIEEGRLVYQVDKVNLSDVAFSVYKEQSIEAQNKGLQFVIDIQNGIKDLVLVDPDRLHEVILNLVGNAVKFTDKGFVKIKVSQPIDGVVRLEVIDSGPGVTPEEQQKLFGKFVRAESSAGKTIGSGLGLYISKLLIEKFGGRIGLVSESGKGSNFWFDLPVSE